MLSPRALSLVMEWTQIYQQELLEAWKNAANQTTQNLSAPVDMG